MNTILVPPALPVERRNSRFVSLRVSRFISSVTFSARATSQEVMFTRLTENWLTSIQFIIIMKIKNYPGLAESIYNYRPCSRWGPAHHPSTKGSPCICASAKMRPSINAGQERNSQRCIKLTCHVKANSNSNLLLNQQIRYPTYRQTQR